MQPLSQKKRKLPVDAGVVSYYFSDAAVVDEYAQAALWVGLWRSEQTVFERLFARRQRLLELGCGAGRISIGLWKNGYRDLTGVDVSPAMVQKAVHLSDMLSVPQAQVRFLQADATSLTAFPSDYFEGAIFGFNGLMQIPKRARRRKAMEAIRRVLVPNAFFVFTTHDRANPFYADFWREESQRWQAGRQNPALVEFGDRWYDSPLGHVFMHVPSREEILEDLALTGWCCVEDYSRCELADEPPEVRQFSDECRFWVAQNKS